MHLADCNSDSLSREFDREVIACRRCPRLIAHCQQIGNVKRRAYQDDLYWAQPVPSFGPLDARLLILGLAPGAHGANRTGRVFTGDSSGNFLYAVLHATGFASQPLSTSREDGLHLIDARITCALHCAPPANRPLPVEIRNCRHWLERELVLLSRLAVVVALGRIAFDNYVSVSGLSYSAKKRYQFGHNRIFAFAPGSPTLITSYHPSQQNTSTGKLTKPMFLQVFERARDLLQST